METFFLGWDLPTQIVTTAKILKSTLLFLLLPLAVVNALGKTIDRSAEEILRQVNSIPFAMESGKSLKLALDQLQKFYQENKSDLTPGKIKKIHQTVLHLKNFEAVRSAMEECQTEKTKTIATQILDSSGQSKSFFINCTYHQNPFQIWRNFLRIWGPF